MTSKHSPADQDLIDSLLTRLVTRFRSSIFQHEYIESNAALFVSHDWIDMAQLRKFLARVGHAIQPEVHPPLLPGRVKIEEDRLAHLPSSAAIKIEDDLAVARQLSASGTSNTVKTRVVKESGIEVLEILTDSESDEPQHRGTGSSEGFPDPGPSSPLPLSDFESESTRTDTDFNLSSDGLEAEPELPESDIPWLDKDVSSRVQLEYVFGLPSIYPIPTAPTAFLIDLSDSRFAIVSKRTGNLFTMDALIKNKVSIFARYLFTANKYLGQDSWDGNTGVSDSKVLVIFEPGQPPILCRRARFNCKGMTDRRIYLPLNVMAQVLTRASMSYGTDLDPSSRDAIFAAQREIHRQQGTTKELRVTEFVNLVRNQSCGGHERGWAIDFKTGHRTYTIPSNVDEAMFLKCFSGKQLANDNSADTAACSAIVHPTTGRKLRNCPYAHIFNGKRQPSVITNHPCPARRTIYVPLDNSIRKALIIHNDNIPHNHPMPPLKKAVHEQKEKYRTCIRGVGTVGATVSKVDNAASTEFLLDGQRPGEYAPALQSNPLKRKLVREEKLASYPAGLDTAGAFNLFWEDLKKPDAKSRYYQRLVMMPDGGVMMLTCLAALMRLLDDEGVTNFETDTTFSRVAGDMNEWEVVIFLKALQRAVTIARAYINKASTQFFERLFDEFQSIKLELTGKPVAFKRLVPGGNLIAMNSDMEGAQTTASSAPMTPPEEVAPEIIKLCVTHAKRGILDFKSLVSDRDYQRLQDVVNIESAEDLDEFSQFVGNLGIEKIQNWWDHKELHPWIIPCLVKSQSPISPDDWDNTPATTNTGEGQHHWTKSRTGVKLALVEAMESARKLDEAVVREIEVSYKSGILVNSQYGAYSRTARTAARHTAVIRKSQEVRERSDEQATIEAEIAEMNETRKQAAERLKELKALKSATKKSSSKSAGKSRTVVASSSSSGRPQIPSEFMRSRLRRNLTQRKVRICGPFSVIHRARRLTSRQQSHLLRQPSILLLPPAAPMAASSDTSRSDSVPIDFNALGDLSDADFFACLDTINSMPMPAVPQTETDDTFGFFAAASTESTGDGNRKRKRKNEVDPENIVHTKRAKRIPRRADEWYDLIAPRE
ncbi:hypothetical protein B0H14DRAFT_3132169 [Mycena olivaceomarginata]|nr:hypothetical protein B0H14DRAFT_3132169 [Mycena olivaceomarginata]